MDKEETITKIKKWLSSYVWDLYLWLSCQTEKQAIQFFHCCYMSHKEKFN